ncbi:SusD family protein [Bacteroidales bacterium Barb4]|nr:SusD family protein [Bacteroidales bacterium Barb4]
MNVHKIQRYVWGLTVSCSLVACDSFLDTDPPSDLVVQEDVYGDIRNVRSVVNGLYTQNLLANGLFYYEIPFYLTPITDDAYHTSTSYDDLRYNAYGPTNTYTAYAWTKAYTAILRSNDLLELLPSTALPEAEKRQNIGEAKYFRAFSYFVLTSLYGDVPWVTSTNIVETTLQPRDPKEVVVGHIIEDLKDAEAALEGSTNPNTKVTKAAASALLARIYLYHSEWQNAEAKADEVIQTSGYSLDAIENVFLRTSTESIFKTSSSGSWSSYVDRVYYANLAVNNNYLRLTDDLVNSFEADDLRKTKWTTTVSDFLHPYKYHRTAATSAGTAEDYVSLRLTEQYLIRAEARAQQDKLPEAVADVNIIRQRAGLSDLPEGLSKAEVLLAIEQERRHEFFAEDAHRWWDLVRTGRADAVLGAYPDKKWEPHKALLPVPQKELDKNSNLTQNPGYGVQ